MSYQPDSAGHGASGVTTGARPPAARRWGAWGMLAEGWLAALLFATLVVGAGYVRSATIWPQAAGLQESPYDDEGVYALAAQLMIQGKQPYRDYFYAHPPLGPLLLTPAIEYHFTPWGSPTSFMTLRYLELGYSAATVGLAFLIGWRLWGVVGGALAGALLVFDPMSVWAGRHVMLEGPLLFLLVLAALLYVLAAEEDEAPWLLLIAAGFFAAAAGGVKLQGLVLLLAFVLDLVLRRRWWRLVGVLIGALLLWAPLWIYLLYLHSGDPLGQFIWLQLLRPADGLISRTARLRQLGTDAPLLLALGALALVSLPLLAFRRPATRRVALRPGLSGVRLRRLPEFGDAEPEPQPHPEPILAPAPSAGVPAALRPTAAWSMVAIWLLLTAASLILTRSYYAHYSVQLALPLALAAGVLPLAIERGLRAGWVGRALGSAVAVAAIVVVVYFGVPAANDDFTAHPDRLYVIVGRYAGDAVGPDSSVFALDAQIPFRAARRPAREEQDRFIVDGYGLLLYHGLHIEGDSQLDLLRRALRDPKGHDPYTVMWRLDVQQQLQASLARSDLAVIDKTSDGRLTDDTRRWLAAHAKLEIQQDRYAIYRIQH
jgi:4-amino-4-deoxy-L-arabinose transferase-like glycosyltransferase